MKIVCLPEMCTFVSTHCTAWLKNILFIFVSKIDFKRKILHNKISYKNGIMIHMSTD